MEEHDKGLNNCCFEKLRISINLYDNRCKVLSFLWAFQIEFSPSIRYCSPLRFGFVCSIMWSISIIWIFQKGRSPNERNQMMQYAFTISRLLGQIEPNYMTGLVDALRQDVYISESLPSKVDNSQWHFATQSSRNDAELPYGSQETWFRLHRLWIFTTSYLFLHEWTNYE